MTLSIRALLLCAVAAACLPHGASAAGTAAQQTAMQSTMQITVGSWGYAADRKDVKADIAKLCDGKASCTFMVKNESLGLTDQTDPSPGNRKGLMIYWKCGESLHKDQFPEGKNAVVKCD